MSVVVGWGLLRVERIVVLMKLKWKMSGELTGHVDPHVLNLKERSRGILGAVLS